MTPLDALAAAIRERLVSGRPAPLPGLGTLVRQHVSARVEERPDGTRVLLPPGETIGLAELSEEHEPLTGAFGRFRGISAAETPAAFAEAVDQMEARLAATGEARLPGVGLLRRTSGGVVLGVEADLLAAVNRTFEGLSPVEATLPARAPEPSTEAPPAEEPTPETPATAPASEPESSDDGSLPSVQTTVDQKPQDEDTLGLPDERQSSEVPPPPEEESGTAFDVEDDELGLTSSAIADDVEDGFEEEDVDLMLPPPEEAADAPLRDLSSDGPSAPFEPPSEAEEETDFEVPEDWTPPSVPTETVPPEASTQPVEPTGASDAEESPAASAFVDDDTLDDDLDNVLAVPFGTPSDETVSDLLPPTDPDEDSDASAPPSDFAPVTTPDEDDWLSDTWTTAAAGLPPPSLGDEEPEIEDAELVDHDVEDVLYVADTPEDGPVVVERVGPEAEFEELFPPPVPQEGPRDTSDVPPAASPPPPATSDRRQFPWWLFALLLLGLLVAAALWLLPRLRSEPVVDSTDEATGTAPLVPPSDAAPLLADSLDEAAQEDSLSETGPAPATEPNTSRPAPDVDVPPSESGAPGAGSSRAPTSRFAILPPRVAGLNAEDARALTGDAITPGADAWTFVVISTSSQDEAQDLSTRYRTAGYRTAVLEVPGSSRRYRVGVGQFSSLDQARRLRGRLPPQAPPGTWVLDLRTL